eukprot:m.144069 g.144069  ORF g.144069 m.144069 type:complete len:659 (-) comp13219_c0_seq2:1443-3419(-)
MFNDTVLSLLVVESDLDCTDYQTHNIDTTNNLLPIMGAMIAFMQIGFALIEAGTVSLGGVTNIFVKNMVDFSVGAIAFYVIGYALSFGSDHESSSSPFIGSEGFFFIDVNQCSFPMLFYYFGYAIGSVTIISGALANRVTLLSCCIYSFIYVAFIYSVAVHWIWSPHGWLLIGTQSVQFVDFAGAGSVHLVGGIASLVGCALIEPRRQRLTGAKFESPPAHSIPLVSTGTWLLGIALLFVNAAPVYTLKNVSEQSQGALVSLSMLNTVLCMGSGLLVYTFWMKATHRISVFTDACNVFICGGVCASSCSPFIQPWAAIVLGMLCCFMYVLFSNLVQSRHIDDVVNASAVHCGGALIGLVVSPWLYNKEGIVYSGSIHSFEQFGWNVLGVLVLVLWSGTTSFVLFLFLKMLKILRLPDLFLKSGVDFFENGQPAYIFTHHVLPKLSMQRSVGTAGHQHDRMVTTAMKNRGDSVSEAGLRVEMDSLQQGDRIVDRIRKQQLLDLEQQSSASRSSYRATKRRMSETSPSEEVNKKSGSERLQVETVNFPHNNDNDNDKDIDEAVSDSFKVSPAPKRKQKRNKPVESSKERRFYNVKFGVEGTVPSNSQPSSHSKAAIDTENTRARPSNYNGVNVVGQRASFDVKNPQPIPSFRYSYGKVSV